MIQQFKIETKNHMTKIYADGVEIIGVRKYTLSHCAGVELPTLTLEFPVVHIEVGGESDVIYKKMVNSNGIELEIELKGLDNITRQLNDLGERTKDLKNILSKLHLIGGEQS